MNLLLLLVAAASVAFLHCITLCSGSELPTALLHELAALYLPDIQLQAVTSDTCLLK